MASDSMRQISHKVQLIGHLNNSINIVRLSQFLKYSSCGFLVYAFDSVTVKVIYSLVVAQNLGTCQSCPYNLVFFIIFVCVHKFLL